MTIEETRGASDWLHAREREHAALHRSGHALLEALALCRKKSGAGIGTCFADELATYRTLLLQHFAEEESSPVFRARERQSPAVRRWIDATLDEHRRFEVRVDALVHASAGEPPDGIEGDVRALLRDLAAHELSEGRLLQRAVFEVEGGLDVVS